MLIIIPLYAWLIPEINAVGVLYPKSKYECLLFISFQSILINSVFCSSCFKPDSICGKMIAPCKTELETPIANNAVPKHIPIAFVYVFFKNRL